MEAGTNAAIEWVVQGILEMGTEKMKAWSREVDLDGDVEKLKSAVRFINMVVSAARGRKIQNEGLLDLKQLLYDAEDVMDELDYYRLQREIEGGNGDGSAAGTHPMGDRASSSTCDFFWRSAAPIFFAKKIVDLVLPNHRKRKREDDTLLALESKHDGSAAGTHPMGDRASSSTWYSAAPNFLRPFAKKIVDLALPNHRKRKREDDTVSQRINKIANQLRTAGDDVRRVLRLEISPTNAMPYQSLGEPRNTRLTTSMQVEPKVYGRDTERNKVVELLINEKYSDLRVLPIVGGGGVGKTTLAKSVYGDQRIRSHFNLKMWVCVSTVFDEVRLTHDILENVCKEDGQDYGKIRCFNVLQDILLKKIRNKRFLLVLDDIWEDKKKIGWDNLLAPLKLNQVPGCMILATTRSKSVAKMIGTMDVVEMKGLDEEDFWLLFKACAFGNENCTDHPTLHTIGQQIAKTLKGYPLAAQSVGALLKENLSKEHWQDVQETWKSRQENDGDILPVLELSYDYLPSHLQHCFSYCSLFPEDHQFNGETLVYAWISQNFVQSKDTSKRLEETGMQYLYRLVDLGFFQKVGSHYVMHDLMHELAEKVSSNDCASINGSKSETIQPSVRHVSIITTAYDKDEHCNFPSEKFENILRTIESLKKLRTLMFFGLSSVNLLKTRSFQSLCKEIESLRLLRIYVTGADIDSVDNFTKLYHLRCLEFVYAPSNNVFASGNQEDIAFPQALTRLYHLQVLGFDAIWGNPTPIVPTHMNNLVNLRHLFANEKVHSTIPSIGNMTSLQELRVFRVQNACGFEIKQLQSMNKLVQLEISQLENVKTKEEASQAKLIDKEHLEKLWLSWDDSGMSLEPTTEGTRDVHVLEGLRPNQNLKYLHITGYSGATSPTWLDSNVSVTSLKTLHLENCPNLESLRLESCTALEELGICGCEQLAVLEGLQYLGSLRILQIDTIGLESLRLESCTALEELYIYRCEQLAVLDLGSLRSLHIEKNSELEIRDCESLRNLTHLHVRRCPRVQIGGYELCHRLERVSIDDPSVLTTSFCEHLTSLQRLEVWGDEVTRQDIEEEVLQLLTSQQEPFFCICSNLVHLPAGLHSLPSLKRLMIYDCKGISRLSEKGLPPSLEKLDIIGCSEELNAHCRMLATSKLKVTISVTVFKALDIKEVMNQPTNSLEQIEEEDG